MEAAKQRIQGLIDRLGDDITIAGVAKRAIVRPARPGDVRDVVSDIVLDSLGRPIYDCVLPAGDASASGNAVTYHGASFTVRGALDFRIAGTVVARRVVIA